MIMFSPRKTESVKTPNHNPTSGHVRIEIDDHLWSTKKFYESYNMTHIMFQIPRDLVPIEHVGQECRTRMSDNLEQTSRTDERFNL